MFFFAIYCLASKCRCYPLTVCPGLFFFFKKILDLCLYFFRTHNQPHSKTLNNWKKYGYLN